MIESSYVAAHRSMALADRSDRLRIEVTGPDRAKVLHNLTTQDIKRLAVGEGCEAFVTSPQGKTLGWVTIHNLNDRMLIRSDPGTSQALLAHLQKNGIFEDAVFTEVTEQTAEGHLVGPQAEVALQALGLELPGNDLGIGQVQLSGIDVRVIREKPAGLPGFTLIFPRDSTPALGDLPLLDAETFESLRIEAGTPRFGHEVTPDRLPQELDRDARAISFVKGCYLGQETVARLDALGHVNKIAIAAIVDNESVPPAGTKLLANGAEVGVVTSSAFSPGLSRGILLGIARVAHAKPGVKLSYIADHGPVELTVQKPPLHVEPLV